MEKGESTLYAVKKELLQETGLRLEGTPVLHGVFHNSDVSKRDHVLVYICEAQGALPTKPPSAEIAEIGYFDLSELPDGTDH